MLYLWSLLFSEVLHHFPVLYFLSAVKLFTYSLSLAAFGIETTWHHVHARCPAVCGTVCDWMCQHRSMDCTMPARLPLLSRISHILHRRYSISYAVSQPGCVPRPPSPTRRRRLQTLQTSSTSPFVTSRSRHPAWPCLGVGTVAFLHLADTGEVDIKHASHGW